MAAPVRSIAKVLFRLSPSVFHPLRPNESFLQRFPGRPCLGSSAFIIPRHRFCQDASAQTKDSSQASDALSRYKERPWDYIESEEYIGRYGTSPVWASYRRNHKGGIPPQKTRKTCIRGDTKCGNPCPICRDPNVIVHHQNVKLLQQFISPQTGMVYDPTRTGLCMKQQKRITAAINTAKDQGLLPFQVPHVDFSGEDFSNAHDAVGKTPPPPSLRSGDSWYTWYSELTPDETEVAKVRKLYRAYLKK